MDDCRLRRNAGVAAGMGRPGHLRAK